MRNLLSDLSIFIDPVTGLLPLEEGYIFEGSVDGVGVPSTGLIDVKRAIADGNKLTYRRIWRGNSEGLKEESNDLATAESNIGILQTDVLNINRTIADDKKLATGKIWRGDVSGNRQESDTLALAESSIVNLNSSVLNIRSDITLLEGDITRIDNSISNINTTIVNDKKLATNSIWRGNSSGVREESFALTTAEFNINRLTIDTNTLNLAVSKNVRDIANINLSISDINTTIINDKKLVSGFIWRGGIDGNRTPSNALTIAEQDIVRLDTSVTTLGIKVTNIEDDIVGIDADIVSINQTIINDKKLTNKKIWVGNIFGVREESNILVDVTSDISTIKADVIDLEADVVRIDDDIETTNRIIVNDRKLRYKSIWRGAFNGIRIESDELTKAEDDIKVNTTDIVAIKRTIIEDKRLTYKKIWRGNLLGVSEESDSLIGAEQNIATLQSDVTSLNQDLIATGVSLGALTFTLSALELNLRLQDLVLTTPSTLFPNAQVLLGKGAGFMVLNAAGQIRTQGNIDINSMPPLAENRIFIGNNFGEVVTKSMDDYNFLPNLNDEEIVVGSRRAAESKLPANFTRLRDAEEANIVAVGTSGFRKSSAKTKGDGSIIALSIKLDDPNDYLGAYIEHKADRLVNRNTTYLWPSYGNAGQVLHVKDNGTLYWDTVENELTHDYIFIGNNRNKAEGVDAGRLPFGEGYLINARDGFDTGRLQRSNVLVSKDGDLSVASIKLRNNYGGYVEHVSSQWSGTSTKYVWPSAEEGKFLKSTNREGRLEWAEFKTDDLDLQNNYILEGNYQGKVKARLPSTLSTARTNYSKIVVTENGSGFRLLDLSLPRDNGKIGQILSMQNFGSLNWTDLPDNTKDLPLVLTSYVAEHDKAQILNRLGTGIAKIDGTGKFSIARERTDYPSVRTVDNLERDSRKHSTDINKNSTDIRQQGTRITALNTRLTTLNTRLTILNGRLTILNGRVSVNTGQITSLWAALAAATAGGAAASIFGAIFSGGGGGGGNTYNTNGVSYTWVINYVNQRINNIKGSDSINVVADQALQYPKYTISVNDSYIDDRIIDKAKIRFFPAGTSVSSFSVGENVVILT